MPHGERAQDVVEDRRRNYWRQAEEDDDLHGLIRLGVRGDWRAGVKRLGGEMSRDHTHPAHLCKDVLESLKDGELL